MKVSAKTHLGTIAAVHLDGVYQDECLFADDKAGYIIRYKKVDGKLFVNTLGNLEQEQVKGKVEITFPERENES